MLADTLAEGPSWQAGNAVQLCGRSSRQRSPGRSTANVSWTMRRSTSLSSDIVSFAPTKNTWCSLHLRGESQPRRTPTRSVAPVLTREDEREGSCLLTYICRRLQHQHGLYTAGENASGYTPEERVTEPGSSMRRHDYHVDAVRLRVVDDLVGGVTEPNYRLDRKAGVA